MKITDLVTDEDKFPTNGKALIKAAIIDYIGSDANGGAVMKRRRNVGLITVGVRPGYPDPA